MRTIPSRAVFTGSGGDRRTGGHAKAGTAAAMNTRYRIRRNTRNSSVLFQTLGSFCQVFRPHSQRTVSLGPQLMVRSEE